MALIKKTPPTPKVLVLVKNTNTCEVLIRAGKKLALENGLPLHILSIQDPQHAHARDDDATERYMRAARLVDADLTVLYAPHATTAVAAFMQQNPSAHFVVGIGRTYAENHGLGAFVGALRDAYPKIPFHAVAENGVMLTLPPAYRRFGLLRPALA